MRGKAGKDGCQIFQPEDQKRVQIWKNGHMIREVHVSKKNLKYSELLDILSYYMAMEDY